MLFTKIENPAQFQSMKQKNLARRLCMIQGGGCGAASGRRLSGYLLPSSATLRFNIMPDYSDRAGSTDKAGKLQLSYNVLRYVHIALILEQ